MFRRKKKIKESFLKDNRKTERQFFDINSDDEIDAEHFVPITNELDAKYNEYGEIKGQQDVKGKKVKSVKIVPLVTLDNSYQDAPHPNLLKPPFSLLIIAKKGSGKSTITINLLKFYKGMFHNRIIFSPTFNIDDNWRNAVKEKVIEPFKRGNIIGKYDEEKLTKIWKGIKHENNDKETFGDKLKTLLIFDDVISDLNRKKNTTMFKIARNHRHYAVSNIIISQEYVGLAPVIRKNATGIVILKTTDSLELKTILDQLSGLVGRWRFLRMYLHCISKPFGFLFINKSAVKEDCYYCNFDILLDPFKFSNVRSKDIIAELNGNTKEGIPGTNEVEEIEEIPKKDLTKCPCVVNKIKDVEGICDNGLNLIKNAMEIESNNKEELIKKLKKVKISIIKKVLRKEQKKINI